MFKKSSVLRVLLILFCFLVGVALVYFGWTLTAQIWGLITMLLGVIFLLFALLFYNLPYKN